MRVSKYHGTGNDFVLIEDLEDRSPLWPDLVRGLCDRHRGVGGDGVIRIVRRAGGDAGDAGDAGEFFMDYWNADGETAEMCGNGIRCLAKYVYDRGLTERTELDVDTRAGPKHLVIDASGGEVRSVTVDMGPPAFERARIPMLGEGDSTFLNETWQTEEYEYRASAVSMGNPHLVLFLEPADELAGFDVRGIGSAIEHDPMFPERTNVEFVKAENGRLAMRVWERGSGETMACGTGACAVLVAANLAGLAKRTQAVEVPGGVLQIDWRDDDHVFLTGPAAHVFEADLAPAWLGSLGEAR